jgi:hypothetical protein
MVTILLGDRKSYLFVALAFHQTPDTKPYWAIANNASSPIKIFSLTATLRNRVVTVPGFSLQNCTYAV